jgi:exodeoxyribonuclease-3
MFKIASWNVNSLRVRLPHILTWLAQHQPDALCVQEIKVTDEHFPLAAFHEAGYHVEFSGQKTYNGVATITKFAPAEVSKDLPDLNVAERRVLGTTLNGVRIWNIYVPNGDNLLSAKFPYKLAWLKTLKNHLQNELKIYPKLIVLGDFNIAFDDRDVHDPEYWSGTVLYCQPVRAALQAMIDTGLHDSFRLHSTEAAQYTWWDYRMNAFKRGIGLRIDHILSSSVLAQACTGCYIDKTPRGWERPSDHTPIIAEFEL